MDEKLLIHWKKVAEELGVSGVAMYRALKQGKIPCVRAGGRIFVSRDWYLQTLERVGRGERLW